MLSRKCRIGSNPGVAAIITDFITLFPTSLIKIQQQYKRINNNNNI